MALSNLIPNFKVRSGPLRGLSVYQGLLALALAVLMVVIIRVFFSFTTSTEILLARSVGTAIIALVAFTLASNVPIKWLPKHAARFLALAVASPLALVGAYALTTPGGLPEAWDHWPALSGWMRMSSLAVGMSLVATLIYIYLERDREAKEQALRFALDKQTLEKEALSARLKAMQAQIEPHFLFNTLANVQQLVEMQSPRAAPLLKNLIQYLKLAIPPARADFSTAEKEFELARHYLAIMQMRMPDRLQFSVELPEALKHAQLPPLALLTLVENAVKHGIDPTEHGGSVQVSAQQEGASLVIQVVDTGRGLGATAAAASTGTGLANLRERLAAQYGSGAAVQLLENVPRGVTARLVLPHALP
jgi:signal transduction histidine kinase